MKVRALAILLPLLASGCASGRVTEEDRTDIYLVLERQRMAWNDGDLADFMDGYARSDELVMAGGGEFRRGWQTVQDRYRASYTPDTMGRLEFSDLEIRETGPDTALVLGRWRIERGPEATGGVFTLILERRPEGWRIVHDHTSAGG